jgi:hypothetical protein
MNCVDLINLKLQSFKNPKYIEIGVRNGETFFAVKAKKKWGVDPNHFFAKRALLKALTYKRNWGFKMFKMKSDEFFLNEVKRITRKHPVDVVFIDGLHTYKQSLRDAVNSLANLNPKGTIIFHDCNPPSAKAAQPRLPTEKINWNGDVWKTIFHFRKFPDFFECFTHDDDQGLGILTWKKFNKKILKMITLDNDIQNLNYEYLNKNRVQALGLGTHY